MLRSQPQKETEKKCSRGRRRSGRSNTAESKGGPLEDGGKGQPCEMQQRALDREGRMWRSAISRGDMKSLMAFAKAASAKRQKQKPNYSGERFLVRKFYLVIDSKNERKQQVTSVSRNQVSRKEVRVIGHLVNGVTGSEKCYMNKCIYVFQSSSKLSQFFFLSFFTKGHLQTDM